jgi:hypothetical protein
MLLLPLLLLLLSYRVVNMLLIVYIPRDIDLFANNHLIFKFYERLK